jgi:UDP-2,4-diacetamido-2,4,6-trideoxy-beta-L-altropyranose hydrolase
MKIAIRADGGNTIGMGHIMRTLVLAKELAKTNEVFYICRIDNEYYRQQNIKEYDRIIEDNISDKYKNGIEKVISEEFKVFFVRENYLIEDIKNIYADLLITDSYDVDENYFKETKAIFKKTAYIDDMNLYYFDVDFLINQNIGAEEFSYKVNDDTKLMLGIKYILLREEFRNLQPKDIKLKVNDIMLTVGGADPSHLTEKVLNWVKDLNYNFHVIVGPSFDNKEDLKRFESDKIRLYYNADMYEIMRKCDMAISACGSTLYELMACGVPTIGIIIADNQVAIGEKLSNIGIIKKLGWYDKIDKDDLYKSIIDLSDSYEKRQKISKEASEFLDGNGVNRIIKMFMEYSN